MPIWNCAWWKNQCGVSDSEVLPWEQSRSCSGRVSTSLLETKDSTEKSVSLLSVRKHPGFPAALLPPLSPLAPEAQEISDRIVRGLPSLFADQKTRLSWCLILKRAEGLCAISSERLVFLHVGTFADWYCFFRAFAVLITDQIYW